MQNVIKLKRELEKPTPDDLMTIRACAEKHGTSKGYIYKLYYKGKIKIYPRGYSKVSESEVLKAMDYGRNK